MKTMKILLVAALATLSTVTFANTANIPGKLYGGFNVSFGGLDIPNVDGESAGLASKYVQDDIHQGFGWHVFGGYLFKVNSQFYLGPELGYVNPTDNTYKKVSTLTKQTEANITYSADYLDLLASGRISINNHIDVIGKFGLASITQTVQNGSATSEGQETAPELVFGAAYNITNNISANVVYDTVLTNSVSKNDFTQADKIADISMINLGMTYTF